MNIITGYRTLLFSLLVAISGVLQATDWVHIIPQDHTYSGLLLVGIGAVIAALRSFTTGPVGGK